MKKFLFAFFGFVFLNFSAQEKKGFQLSSHILDISIGKPAEHVQIELEKYNESTQTWVSIGKKETDSNGRVSDFLPYQKDGNNGKYKLVFFIGDYYKNTESFYPYIEIIFRIKDNEHYHVPITLSPYGYSTYRGS